MKKAQVWYVDFSIGLLIFALAMSGYMAYIYFGTVEDKGDIADLIIDAKLISSSLTSTGYPTNWNATNVTRIGIAGSNYRISEEKLGYFNNFSYSERGSLLGTTKDYYFYLETLNGTRFNKVGVEGTSSSKLIQITRLMIYNGSFVKVKFHLWED